MRFGRRLHFQLTPLLDLLLIVIFAQYLDVQQQAERQTLRAERRLAERERDVARKLTEAESSLEAERRALATERDRLAGEWQSLDDESAELRTRLNDVVEQQRRAADLVAELFDVPDELIEEALKPLPPGTAPRPPEDAERLRRRFEELASLRGPQVVEHLLTYEELRKRADVWTVRVLANGEIIFSTGDRTQSFRAAAPDEFAARLFDRYKSLPQPKGLVVLLVSYGDARADARRSVLAGLPDAVRLMREDQLGRTQFEYAVLGFIPDEARR